MRLHDRDEFRFKIPPLMRTFLVDQAADNLERHKIHEPVLWEPPSEWCQEPAWPGSTPDSISHAGFPAMAAAGTRRDDIARVMRLPPEHLRLYCDATGITAPPSSPKEPGLGHRTPRRGLLAPEALRDAHRTGGLNQSHIARQIGCSPSTVQNALDEAGIRRSRRPEPLNAHITREQLEHAYLHQRRSLPDIAEELRVDKDRLTLLAKKWAIPIRPNSTTSNPFALLPHAPPLSELIAAISDIRNCVERLRRLVQLPGQRNLCAAAKHLGTRPTTLTSKRNLWKRQQESG
ncbi:hypothetical protein ACFVGN_33125 [Streptomyces sp. NPDC057757]|uniref:hypothetical protein n=1 Tax=Streptomyces sp. NPDC057757 TaxID=3346241 RepID=UPI0036A4E768